jgi:hypothetical protein
MPHEHPVGATTTWGGGGKGGGSSTWTVRIAVDVPSGPVTVRVTT